MKTKITRFVMVAAMCTATILGAIAQDFAHDFECDGIYYDILSETEVAVADAPFAAPYSGDVVIPSQVSYDGGTYTVTEIGDYAFCGSGVTLVSMPNTVKTIDHHAFYTCFELTKVEMSSQVEYIGNMAFDSCGITSIELPNTLKRIGEEAFSESMLESVDIPASVETIEGMAFAYTENLAKINVDVENKVYCSIDGVLYDKHVNVLIACPAKKTEIEIPIGVLTIGDAAFGYCRNLKDFDMPRNIVSIGIAAFEGCVSLTKVELPDNLTTIGGAAFYGCTGLKSISLGKQLRDMDEDTFGKCSNLTQVTIDEANETFAAIDNVVYAKQGTVSADGMVLLWCPGGLQSVTVPEGVVAIGEEAFSRCEKLKSVQLPGTLQRIEDYAFEYCSSLTEMSIPESVVHFGTGLFYSCAELQKVSFAENIQCKEISVSMFSECKNLTTFTVPDGFTTIGSSAFARCENLATVTIGQSVNYLGYGAFQDCSALNNIYCRPTMPPSIENDYSFTYMTYDQATLYVPVGSKADYEVAPVWKDFANIVETDFSGVENAVADSDIKVCAIDGTITVIGVADGTTVEVYGIGGGCVYRGIADSISGLPAGIYVVRTVGQATKVVLK